MNKTEETKTADLISAIDHQNEIIERLISGKPVVNLDESLAYYKSLVSQSQSPDKEQPKELEELLEKELPVMPEDEYYQQGSDLPYYDYWAKRQDLRYYAKQFFEAGKGAQGRETKWISVEERLPEKDENTKSDFGYRSKLVFVLNNGKSPYVSDYSFMPDGSGTGWMSINAPNQNITHWMPLPESPNTSEIPNSSSSQPLADKVREKVKENICGFINCHEPAKLHGANNIGLCADHWDLTENFFGDAKGGGDAMPEATWKKSVVSGEIKIPRNEENLAKNDEEIKSPDIKAFVKKWMAGHEPDTFVKNEHGQINYTAGHSTLNLPSFFEDILQDFYEEFTPVPSYREVDTENMEKEFAKYCDSYYDEYGENPNMFKVSAWFRNYLQQYTKTK